MKKEIWKPIPNFSRYEASDKGRLRSTNYKNSGKTKVLKPALANDGYLKTMLLNDDGKYRSWTVHLFICLTFLGEKPKGYEVNHMDGNKTNNSINNLEYVTRSENIKHAYNYGLITPKVGASNGNSKLTEDDIIAIREHAKKNSPRYGRDKLADKYGVSSAYIKEIVNGRKTRRSTWSHI